MVHLRATKKVLKRMHAEAQEGEPSANALGDWFVTRFVCRTRPFLLLMSSTTRLTILDSAKDVRQLPQRIPQLVEQRLIAFGIQQDRIQQEIEAMGEVMVGVTNDRSHLGAMNTFVEAAKIFMEDRIEILHRNKVQVEYFLEGHLTRRGKHYIHPGDAVREMLG